MTDLQEGADLETLARRVDDALAAVAGLDPAARAA